MSLKRNQHFSLSLRISLLLVCAAILPLLTATAIIEFMTRPALIVQANLAMQSDAKTRVQLINTYLTERLLDTETLSQVPSIQQFLATPPADVTSDLITHALYGLAAGQFRDKRYTAWTLFDPHGSLRLSYPLSNQQQTHGQTLVPSVYLQAVIAGKIFASSVSFNSVTHRATVDLYAPIVSSAPEHYLGFIRATLSIDYIWSIVSSDRGANGAGSYAFILDQNGVRIADADASRLFTAIAPLPVGTQHTIAGENLYGNQSVVPILPDKALTTYLQGEHPAATFQLTPAGQNEPFQVAQLNMAVVPWTYIVLSPLSTVTAVANQQLWVTSLIAVSVLVLAALAGSLIGQQLARPILRAVEALLKNSHNLTKLAKKQEDVAVEQTWVLDSFLDSSQVGLQAVQYNSHVTRMTIRRLHTMTTDLLYAWPQLDPHIVEQTLRTIVATTQYLQETTRSQETGKQKLDQAVNVMGQVNEQLVTGATSAALASAQLELVVNDLREVVGKKQAVRTLDNRLQTNRKMREIDVTSRAMHTR